MVSVDVHMYVYTVFLPERISIRVFMTNNEIDNECLFFLFFLTMQQFILV